MADVEDAADLSARVQAELARTRSVAAELAMALATLDAVCGDLRAALQRGTSPIEAYRSSRFDVVRDQYFAAVDRFHDQLTKMRSEGVRLLVEEEGQSLTEVAALIGRSRQFVTRLYRQACGD